MSTDVPIGCLQNTHRRRQTFTSNAAQFSDKDIDGPSVSRAQKDDDGAHRLWSQKFNL